MATSLTKYLALSLLGFFVSINALAEVGFSSGNTLSANSVAGDLTLTCTNDAGTSRTVSFQCRDSILIPVEYDSFVGPAGAQADSVELMVLHEDGSSRVKSLPYEASRGTSRTKFNLWVNTLLQTPILSYGENHVTYTLRLRGALVSQGQFVASVKTGGLNQCPATEYRSNTDSDCDQPYTYCQRFFQEKNFCQ